jgi:hypothetical protein
MMSSLLRLATRPRPGLPRPIGRQLPHHPTTLSTPCPFCTIPQPPGTGPAQLRDHLRHDHRHTSYGTLDTTPLTAAGLHICPDCNSTQATFARPQDLQHHRTHYHPAPPPNTLTNTDLVMATYRAAHATQWHSTLQWLHQLTPEPPPYRTNLWRKLNHTTPEQPTSPP